MTLCVDMGITQPTADRATPNTFSAVSLGGTGKSWQAQVHPDFCLEGLMEMKALAYMPGCSEVE